MIEVIEVILVFMYVGVMAIGGGLATIPLLIQTVVERNWISLEKFYSIVAISEATPGPVGLNIATYIGYEKGGIILAILASVALIIPSFIIVYFISNFLNKYYENKYVKRVMSGLRTATVGLISSALIIIMKETFLKANISFQSITDIFNNLDYIALIGFILIVALYKKFKLNVIYYILLGGIYGILVYSIF